MLDLNNINYAWILVPIRGGVDSFLHSRGMNNQHIKFLNESGIPEDWCISFTEVDNNEVRVDSIHMLNHFGVDKIFLKYKGVTNPVLLESNGGELESHIGKWGESKYNWFLNNYTFSIDVSEKWFKPTKPGDFKIGSIVECLSDGKWIRREVMDPQKEWVDIWDLMVKWDRVRIKG